jgi:hypothetical protein
MGKRIEGVTAVEGPHPAIADSAERQAGHDLIDYYVIYYDAAGAYVAN